MCWGPGIRLAEKQMELREVKGNRDLDFTRVPAVRIGKNVMQIKALRRLGRALDARKKMLYRLVLAELKVFGRIDEALTIRA